MWFTALGHTALNKHLPSGCRPPVSWGLCTSSPFQRQRATLLARNSETVRLGGCRPLSPISGPVSPRGRCQGPHGLRSSVLHSARWRKKLSDTAQSTGFWGQ